MPSALIVLSLLGVVSVLIWLGILLHPAQPWDFRPVGDEGRLPPAPQTWPTVRIFVPARNESAALPYTLPALLQQNYPGDFTVLLIDDRSTDNTAEVARQLAAACGVAERLTVLSGSTLPEGWVGKVWALEQGAIHSGLSPTCSFASQSPSTLPDYLLLTDADIHHTAGSLRRLVAESEEKQLALNSRMARLRCVSGAECLLIPAFVFFFNLLYPMRQVNDQQSPVAAAAGGCVLLTAAALQRIGGFVCIKDRIIDDVSLAQTVKHAGLSISLALSRHEVKSWRAYGSLAAIWLMVRRSAFTELRHSWLRLAGTVLGLVTMFLVPLVSVIGGGIGLALATVWGLMPEAFSWAVITVTSGCIACALMALVYGPAVRFYELSRWWVWTLPLAGILYGAMTVDSALQHLAGKRTQWRDL